MKRLTLKIVFSGLVMACRRATCPTSRSLVLGLTATTEGVKRLPSAFSSTVGSPPSMIATTELVVPRSIPSTLGMVVYSTSLVMVANRQERVARLNVCEWARSAWLETDRITMHMTSRWLRELRMRRAGDFELGLGGRPYPEIALSQRRFHPVFLLSLEPFGRRPGSSRALRRGV